MRGVRSCMALFEYQALDEDGRLTKGTLEAVSPADMKAQLNRVGVTTLTSTLKTAGGGRSWRERLTPEPPAQDITGFTLDLAMLLKGGVSLDEALGILARMETRRWLVKLIGAMHGELAGGKSFSAVLQAHPKVFPPLYTKMIEAAEISGRLVQALEGIAAERQRRERLRKRLTGAVAYPAFLAVAATGVLFFVLIYIIPQFEGAIAPYRDRIAPSTLFVFDLSAFVRARLDWIVAGAAAALLAFVGIGRMMKARSLWAVLLSALPFTRSIAGFSLTLTFCRTLSILIENGVDISTSLRLIRNIVAMPGAAEKIDRTIAEVRGGARLSAALAQQTLLPSHVVQMLRVGEGAGNLAESAARIGDFYEAKLDTALARLTAIAGPLLMMAVSVLVAWLILSVMSALLSINDLLV